MADLAPFTGIVGEEGWKRIREAAVRDRFGEAGFYGMTVGELTTVISGDVRPLYRSGGRTVYDNEVVAAFREWMDTFCAALKGLTLPPLPETAGAMNGTRPSTFEESLYVFCRSYFCLRSFSEADRLKVSEYLLARKDEYNKAVVDRNITKKTYKK